MCGNLEKGYMLIIFIFAKLFRDYHYSLFFIQLLISIGIFAYAYKKRKNVSMIFIILVYLFLYYNETLTIMRQGISLVLILLSLEFLNERKYIKTLILYFLAIMFHTSSIISIIIYFFIILENSKVINKNSKNYIYIFIIGMIAILFIFIKPILEIFTFKIPILPDKFYRYFDSDYATKSIIYSKFCLLFKLVWIGISLIMLNQKRKNKEIKLGVIFLFIDMIIYIASFKLEPLMRLGLYFSFPSMMIIVPKVATIFKRNNRNQITVNACVIFLLIFWWIYMYGLTGSGGDTCPYTSSILTNFWNNL